ncbi:DUF2491 family protein [Pseudomonas sp. REB1044]|uniref:DUF2491 family protein n=1 Tax=Pseudomonas sp. REB1044 TaxID=2675224 RepID=UPI00315D14CE
MGWLKRLLGFQAPRRETGNVALAQLPFGLASGATLTLDPALGPRLSGHAHLLLPQGPQPVWAVGEVPLDASMRLARFYLDDEDYWLQVVMNGPRASQAGDIVLFGYHRVQPIADDEAFKRLAGASSTVGLAHVVHDGEIFARQWGTDPGQARLVPLTERVSNPETRYLVRHLSMLYARDTGLPERREFLLFSVEEDAAGSVCLSTSLGITLYPMDFHVT